MDRRIAYAARSYVRASGLRTWGLWSVAAACWALAGTLTGLPLVARIALELLATGRTVQADASLSPRERAKRMARVRAQLERIAREAEAAGGSELAALITPPRPSADIARRLEETGARAVARLGAMRCPRALRREHEAVTVALGDYLVEAARFYRADAEHPEEVVAAAGRCESTLEALRERRTALYAALNDEEGLARPGD